MFQPSVYSGASHRDRQVRYSAQQMLGIYAPGSHYGFIGAPTGGLATVAAGLDGGATGAQGASAPGPPWDAVVSKVFDAGSDIAVGWIGAKSGERQQKALIKHQEKLYKLQQAATEKEYKRQERLANLQTQMAKMGGDTKVLVGLGVVGLLTVLLVTKPWK